ncbi:MAG TPA: hypothetical protein VFT58_06155 [Nitrososphaera sp.]|nr:hypothetical protein [Nitrososphaera sp.]
MGGSSKTTSENKPPKWAEGLFVQSADEASKLYNSGAGGNPYMGSAVADLSDTTMQGVNQLANAGQAWDTSGTRGLFGQIGAAAAGPSYAEQNLSQIASGQDNPYFEEALNSQLDKAAARVQSLMGGAGRLGSGANTGVLASELGGIRSNALFNQWNQNIQNQLAATGQMDTARFGGLDRAASAADAMAGLDQQNFQNRLAGAGATLQAGNILDNQAQQQLSDEVRRFYETDNADWTRLGMLQAAAAGAAGPYGTQIATTRQSPGLGSILGGVGSLMGGK